MPSVSVVIATCNRSLKLRACLHHLGSCRVPEGTALEVVVVDNNSTDSTREEVVAAAASAAIPVRYVFEPGKGASCARNTGIAAAVGDIIAIVDDDCYVAPDWLENLVQSFEQDEALSGLGGRVELYDAADLPLTTKTSREPAIFQGEADVFSAVPGCNMAYRRRVIDGIGGYDERMGPGTSLPAAEDGDLVYRALKSGAKLGYCPNVVVYHHHGRRSADDKAKLNRSYCLGRGGFHCKHVLKGDATVVRWTYWQTRSLVVDCLNFKKKRTDRADSRVVLLYLFLGFLRALPVFLLSKPRQRARA